MKKETINELLLVAGVIVALCIVGLMETYWGGKRWFFAIAGFFSPMFIFQIYWIFIRPEGRENIKEIYETSKVSFAVIKAQKRGKKK